LAGVSRHRLPVERVFVLLIAGVEKQAPPGVAGLGPPHAIIASATFSPSVVHILAKDQVTDFPARAEHNTGICW